jgi:hypothetical protein
MYGGTTRVYVRAYRTAPGVREKFRSSSRPSLGPCRGCPPPACTLRRWALVRASPPTGVHPGPGFTPGTKFQTVSPTTTTTTTTTAQSTNARRTKTILKNRISLLPGSPLRTLRESVNVPTPCHHGGPQAVSPKYSRVFGVPGTRVCPHSGCIQNPGIPGSRLYLGPRYTRNPSVPGSSPAPGGEGRGDGKEVAHDAKHVDFALSLIRQHFANPPKPLGV